jgi:hypothetical protein
MVPVRLSVCAIRSFARYQHESKRNPSVARSHFICTPRYFACLRAVSKTLGGNHSTVSTAPRAHGRPTVTAEAGFALRGQSSNAS